MKRCLRFFLSLFIVFIRVGGVSAASDLESHYNYSGQTSNIQKIVSIVDNATSASGKKAISKSTTDIHDEPKTIRDFFMLLPENYFVIEGCEPGKDKDCRKAKIEYLEKFVDVEDNKNAYLRGGCEGAQPCLTMTLFKRSDGSYLVAVTADYEMITEQYFLDYKNRQWVDVSAEVIPKFSKHSIYELPRQGTSIKVFEKKIIEKGDNYEISDKGKKLYDLIWKDGKFWVKE